MDILSASRWFGADEAALSADSGAATRTFACRKAKQWALTSNGDDWKSWRMGAAALTLDQSGPGKPFPMLASVRGVGARFEREANGAALQRITAGGAGGAIQNAFGQGFPRNPRPLTL